MMRKSACLRIQFSGSKFVFCFVLVSLKWHCVNVKDKEKGKRVKTTRHGKKGGDDIHEVIYWLSPLHWSR